MSRKTCELCSRSFKSAQALRAHRRFCAGAVPMRGVAARAGAVPGIDAGAEPDDEELTAEQSSGFNRVRDMHEQVLTAKERLELREIQSKHEALDEVDEKKAAAARGKAEEGRLAQLRERDESRERARGERQEKEDRRQRRAIVQRVKDQAMEGIEWQWALSGVPLTPEIRGEILDGIEQKLLHLPVEDLPGSELVTIAKGVADRCYRVELKAKEELASQKVAARRDRLRVSNETENEQWGQSQLIAHAESYARKELEDATGYNGIRLPFSEQTEILGKVKKAVTEKVATLDTHADAEDLVEEVLEDFGF